MSTALREGPQRLLAALHREADWCRSAWLASVLGLTPQNAQQMLVRLHAKGLVERRGQAPNVWWRLAAKAPKGGPGP